MPLAFHFEEITPRELKPTLLELHGISRAAVEAHYKLYQGYVGKRNEILTKLADVDLSSANQVLLGPAGAEDRPHLRDRGIKNHELYFDHLGATRRPGRPGRAADQRDFGSSTPAERLEGDGMAGRAGVVGI